MKKWLACLLAAGFVYGARPPDFAASYTSTPVTVNGLLNEWGDLSAEYGLLTFTDSDSSASPEQANTLLAKMAWDGKCLYFAFFMRDRDLIAHTRNNEEKPADDDCIEIFLDTRNDSGMKLNSNDYHLIIGLNGNLNVRKGASDLPGYEKLEVPQMISEDLDVRLAVRPFGTINNDSDRDSGYAAEAAVTLASLSLNPVKRNRIRVNFAFGDNDTRPGDPKKGRNAYSMLSDRWMTPRGVAPNQWAWLLLEGVESVPAGTFRRPDAFTPRSLFLMLAVSAAVLTGLLLLLFFSHRRSKQIRAKLRNELDFKIKAFIDDNFKARCSLEDFCGQYNLSVRQVQRWIKSDLSATFNDLLTDRRLREARRLLDNTDKNVSEICFEVGYNDCSYFTKVFRQKYGLAPRETRKTRE